MSVKSPQYRLCRREFLRRGLSLNRQKLAAGPQQSRRPADQPIQRRYRTRGRDIGANCARQLFRPPADNPNVLQPQLVRALLKEHAPTQHRLHQDHS
jgi:hypothetical protein